MKMSYVKLTIAFSALSLSIYAQNITSLNQDLKQVTNCSPQQEQELARINQSYLLNKERLLNNTKQIAKNTAILANWDEWTRAVKEVLTPQQYSKFMNWQGQLDLLADIN